MDAYAQGRVARVDIPEDRTGARINAGYKPNPVLPSSPACASRWSTTG